MFETSIALSMVKSAKSPFCQTLLVPISWTLAIYTVVGCISSMRIHVPMHICLDVSVVVIHENGPLTISNSVIISESDVPSSVILCPWYAKCPAMNIVLCNVLDLTLSLHCHSG